MRKRWRGANRIVEDAAIHSSLELQLLGTPSLFRSEESNFPVFSRLAVVPKLHNSANLSAYLHRDSNASICICIKLSTVNPPTQVPGPRQHVHRPTISTHPPSCVLLSDKHNNDGKRKSGVDVHIGFRGVRRPQWREEGPLELHARQRSQQQTATGEEHDRAGRLTRVAKGVCRVPVAQQ